MKQKQAHYALHQQEGSSIHKLYIYDDVKEYGDFDWWTWDYTESETSAEYFRKALAEIPETDVIELHINSYGGSVKEGVAIYNQLKQKKCREIVAYVDGYAYSIASVIMQAADRRVMGLGTSILIHNMWMTVSGNADQLRKSADDLDILMESNRAIYMARAKVSEDELISMMDAETYLTPEQAVAKGFADEIYETDKDVSDRSMEQMQQHITELQNQLRQQCSFKQELEHIHRQSMTGNRGQTPDGTKGRLDETQEQAGRKTSVAELFRRAAQIKMKEM